MTKMICDYCEKEVGVDYKNLKILTAGNDIEHKNINLDLHPGCYKEIMVHIKMVLSSGNL